MKKLIQIQLHPPLLPLLVFGRKFTLNFPLRESWLTIFPLTTASAVPSVRFKNRWINFLAEGWKVDSNQLPLPLLVFWTKIHVESNFPGKVDSQFLRSLQGQCSTKRSLQKLMDNFLAEGVKKLIQINSFTLLVFWTKIHVELSRKVDSQFYAHYSQCSTKRSLQNWWTTF